MKKLGVVVGHEKNAPGADLCKPYGLSEYEYNSEIAHLIFEYGSEMDLDVEIFFRDGVGISGAYKKARAAMCDVIIELHFNCANAKASGTEVLSSKEAKDLRLSKIVLQHLTKLFKLPNRGVKVVEGLRGGQSVTSFPGGANCLVEPAFGDNPKDAKLLMGLKHEYAKALVSAAREYLA
jgi:N-acetylmuramoyl-L-alanine amidase